LPVLYGGRRGVQTVSGTDIAPLRCEISNPGSLSGTRHGASDPVFATDPEDSIPPLPNVNAPLL